MKNIPLSALQVVGVRYRGSKPAEDDERCLDAFSAAGAYAAAAAPFDVTEPVFPEAGRSGDEPNDIGLLCGEIADAVAAAHRLGKAVLMTGGNCCHITGVLGGLQDVYGPGARIGLVWFDAHGDFNTPSTTLTGSLGGMPVAVAAGLAYPGWREGSHMAASVPTDRILLVDVRNLDPAEEQLIRATETVIAAPAPGFPGEDLGVSVARLAERCDIIYLHIDADILDGRYVPNHGTREPDGPDMAQVQAAIETVMATGKVAAYAIVSVYGGEPGRARSVASGIELIRRGLAAWARHGMAGCSAFVAGVGCSTGSTE